MTPTTSDLLLIAAVGGGVGATVMYLAVRILNALGWAKGDILLAIGHSFLHRRKNAFRIGLLL
jgi:hypothetical protein